ncbi:archease [Candidatus Woesearchaeota archaeon]|nr:archease [Candidatus Woesearchaeota archaeon]MBW3016238.1 archease [Candidatus Woesearchaeota archaeon]
MPFKFIEDVSLADVAFEATGKNLDELFDSSARAVFETMADPKTIKPKVKKIIKKKAKSIENLLFEFLEEIIYLKDKDAVVFNDVKVKVDEGKIEVVATVMGDKIQLGKQELRQDVKAVTMHYYKVEKNKFWKASVVLDV